jgi:hypothetical protein
VGSVTHCAHGKAVVIEEILDYRPNDYLTLRSANPMLPFKMVMTFELEPTVAGTHMRFLIERPRKKEHLAAIEQFGGQLGDALRAAYALMGSQAGDETKRLLADRVEPDLPELHNADGFLQGITPIQMVG